MINKAIFTCIKRDDHIFIKAQKICKVSVCKLRVSDLEFTACFMRLIHSIVVVQMKYSMDISARKVTQVFLGKTKLEGTDYYCKYSEKSKNIKYTLNQKQTSNQRILKVEPLGRLDIVHLSFPWAFNCLYSRLCLQSFNAYPLFIFITSSESRRYELQFLPYWRNILHQRFHAMDFYSVQLSVTLTYKSKYICTLVVCPKCLSTDPGSALQISQESTAPPNVREALVWDWISGRCS